MEWRPGHARNYGYAFFILYVAHLISVVLVYFYKWLAFNELLIYLHINISERWNDELVGLIGK